MIDVHCHFDMAQSPQQYILNNERRRIATIGMTNLPSHFEMGIAHVRRYKYIRLALGLHPLLASSHASEYSKFKKLLNETSYIGEVGLDFSREGYSTKGIQIKSFEFVLDNVRDKKKILSLHSRRAESETLELLLSREIKNAVFHWYTGSLKTLNKIVDAGYMFSINSAMLASKSGKSIVNEIPKELVLTETDYPYIDNNNIDTIHLYLSEVWRVSTEEVDKIINNNFNRIIEFIR